jgi:Na+/melibiose symporter-like transporter
VALLALTILISGAVAPAVRDAAGGGIPGYRAMGLFVAVLIVLGALGAFFGTRNAPRGTEERSEPSLRAQLAVVAGNRPFRVLVACFVAQAAGVAAMLAGVQYFADHVLHNSDAVTYLFAGVVAPALLVMPLWRRVGERLGKLRGYVVASLMITVTTLALGLSAVLPLAAVYAFVALLGVGYAGQQLFGLAMLPDCIAYDTARTGRRQAGVFTGVWTAGETFGLALGPQVFGLMLQLFGYQSSTSGHSVAQTSTAELGVLLGFTVVPGVIVGLALLFLRRYDLSPDRVDAPVPAPAVVS